MRHGSSARVIADSSLSIATAAAETVCSISGAGYSRTLFRGCQNRLDQAFGHIISIAPFALSCSSHVQWLAALIEQFAGERTPRRVGLAAFTLAARLPAKNLLIICPLLATEIVVSA